MPHDINQRTAVQCEVPESRTLRFNIGERLGSAQLVVVPVCSTTRKLV